MTHYLGAPVTGTTPALSITVPTGVTPLMAGLLVVATADGADWDPVPARPGAVFTLLDDRAATNMRVTIWSATGLAAGDVITWSATVNAQGSVQHIYQDEYTWLPGPAAAIRAGSSAVCVSGAVVPAAGQRVALVALERTAAAGTTVVSVASSGGETVTSRSFAEVALTATSVLFGDFTASAAASRTVSVTYSGSSGNGYAALLLTGPPAAAAGVPVRYTSAPDTLADAELWYTDDAGELAAPVEARAVPDGYGTVATMLAEAEFLIAHRGGSAVWPEMSIHAYTQAVNWGCGALEFSVGRSSDGVLFGLHDETLDRTSGTTGFVASEHTWAEIQTHLIAPPVGSPTAVGKPYVRLSEVVEAFPGHVMFIDPKHLNTTHRAELLTYLLTVPNATTRFVWKYFGPATNIALEGSSRGFTTWGYYYEEDDLPASQAAWSLLGMDYSASQTAWDEATSFGKPVIGHVVATLNQANQARARGADGLQVAGVTVIVPRA